jgi:hypothetical protein
VISEKTTAVEKERLLADYEDHVASYESQFYAYMTWLDEDARTGSILTDSMEDRFAFDIMDFERTRQMWSFLHQKYESTSQSTYLAAIHQEQLLCQGDSTVEDFFDQLYVVWRQLDTLSPQLSPATYPSYRDQTDALELHQTCDFLTRLCDDFEPLRAQLVARRPYVSLMDALAEVHNEEVRLRDVDLLQSATVLAACSSASRSLSARPTASVPLASPPVVPPAARGESGGLHCAHCGRDGHVEAFCYRKKKAHAHHSSQGTGGTGSEGSKRSSAGSETQEILMLLRRLVTSTSIGTIGTVTQSSTLIGYAPTSQSSTLGPPTAPSPGTYSWYLDYDASFYMTPHSAHLSCLRHSSRHCIVHIADGSPLSVAGQDTLSSDSFHVLDVSLVPDLTMQLMSAGQIADHDCHVILDIQDHRTGHLVGIGPRHRESQHLWELDWLHLPSAASDSPVSSACAALSTSSFAQWHHRLGHLSDPQLSALLRRGLLGSILGRESLDHCQGCRLGKQVQLSYPSSESVS